MGLPLTSLAIGSVRSALEAESSQVFYHMGHTDRRLRYLQTVVGRRSSQPVANPTRPPGSAPPPLSARTVGELEVDADDLDLTAKAAALFWVHGCVVIRGLNNRWVPAINEAVRRTVAQSRRLEELGRVERVAEGWVTPDGTLFIPAAWDGTPTEQNRHKPVMDLVAQLGDTQGVEKQIMVPAVD